MILFRHGDRRYPFFWEQPAQPIGRWHGTDEGPVQYLADTSHGAWAEYLRHEEIVDEVDLAGVERAFWAIEVDVDDLKPAALPYAVMTGDQDTYEQCRSEARHLRDDGSPGFTAPSAALVNDGATGHRVDGGIHDGPPRDGVNYILFGRWPEAVGWTVVDRGRPPVRLLPRVRHFST
ncbi:hypothetical protein BKD30_11560 [Tersicoccus phoenicis]|uniref:RES domain-containing protein n=1 Tax=Tersicoccus phoenicis TaxID=554083 RepID=A0A1R1L7P3_9MICC|nr:RES family NAD+ phosphorylase [Tersicoccus phoenicis]OMH23554.1 hypothetical protein BKD30_11560 [Tersicoccus phoenicis]